MNPLYTTAWLIWLLLSVAICLQLIGFRGLTTMFPEGHRWWHTPLQLASLAHFALVVLCNPFWNADGLQEEIITAALSALTAVAIMAVLKVALGGRNE